MNIDLRATLKGELVTVKQFEDHSIWSKDLLELLTKDAADGKSTISRIKIKPLSTELLYGALDSSPTLSCSSDMYNLAMALYAKAGANKLNQVYFGILDMQTNSLSSLKKPKGISTVHVHGTDVEVQDLVLGYLISVALNERIRLLCNRMHSGLHNRWLKRYRSTVAHILLDYYQNTVVPVVTDDKVLSIGNTYYVSESYYNTLANILLSADELTQANENLAMELATSAASNRIIRSNLYYRNMGIRPTVH